MASAEVKGAPMSNRKKVVAIIPARGGSKGVPGKNLRKVGGVPLVARSIEAASSSERIDAVYVTSDDPSILKLATECGAIAINRPLELARDESSSEDALVHALLLIEAGGDKPEIVVFLQCTSPFTTADDINALVDALNDETFDCSLTVSRDHSFLWRLSADGSGKGVNHDETAIRQRRQDREAQFRENGAGYAMRVGPFLERRHRFCGPVALVETLFPPIEIDEPGDIELAEALSRRMGSGPIPESSLASIRALVTDFDGVHTDDFVYVRDDGHEHVRCSRSDGMGIEMLRNLGIPTLILSKESNPVVTRRAQKLRSEVLQGVDDKLDVLRTWMASHGFRPEEVAYIGNDINDVSCLLAVGLPCVPCDAHPEARRNAKLILSSGGGAGAIREFAELLIAARS